MKAIKITVEDEVWEKFFRLYPDYGERSHLIRNFVYRKIREATMKQIEEEEEK